MDLEINNLSFKYTSVPILENVSFKVSPGEILGILGPNGSGKTTLMKCMNQVLKPECDSITFGDTDLTSAKRSEISKIMGYVPQNSINETAYPTVYEVVMMGRRPYGSWMTKSDDNEIVWAALERMGVTELADRRFDRLSSGQTQRVLMARAIAQGARVMLLDEPTSNLDIKYQIDVMETVRELARSDGISVCAIIHDLDLAMKYCDKAILLYKGGILAAGDVTEVITPENIRTVYEVEIKIDDSYGRPHVVIP